MLIDCPSCGKQVSSEAAACPGCGHQFKAAGGLNLSDPVHLVGVILIIVLFIGFIAVIVNLAS